MGADFRDVENEVTSLYLANEFAAALRVIDTASADFATLGHRTRLVFFRACLLARTEAPDAALEALEAGITNGLWWSEAMLADADLDPCRGTRLDQIAAHARPQEPASRVLTGANPTAGVLFALHGGSYVIDEHDNPWGTATRIGWAVHCPVSSQRIGAGLATWTDLDLAVDECRTHLAEIGEVDAIGAFSLGASLALRLVTEVVRVPVIMVAPSLRPTVVASALPNLDGALIDMIVGERDPYLPRTKEALPALIEAGASVDVQTVLDLAHDFPPDFDERLRRKLDKPRHAERQQP